MEAKLLKGVDHDAYHRDQIPGSPRFSRTAALRILKSPLACWAWHPSLGGGVPEDEEETTEAVRSGSLIHALLLGAGPRIALCDYKDWRTDRAKADRALAQQNGLLPVLKHKHEAAMKDVRAIRERLHGLGVELDAYEPEATALWESDGISCKARKDLVAIAQGHIVDLKVVDSINPQAFERSVAPYGLDIQQHVYTEALEAVHPALAGRVRFDFAVCERRPPYDVMLVSLAPTFVSLGELRWKRALKTWRRCLKSGEWPGIGRVAPINAKEWALTEELAVTTSQAGEPAFMKGDL